MPSASTGTHTVTSPTRIQKRRQTLLDSRRYTAWSAPNFNPVSSVPSPQFRPLGGSGELRRGYAEVEEGPAEGRRRPDLGPRTPGPGLRERRCSGDTPVDPANSSDTHLRSRFPFMELGGVLRARRAPATGGKAAAQGATRCDRQPHLATGRGGHSLFSVTAAKTLLGRSRRREAARD